MTEWEVSHFICEGCGRRLEATREGRIKDGGFKCPHCGSYQVKTFYRKVKTQKY